MNYSACWVGAILFSAMSLWHPFLDQEEGWTLQKQKNGIQVYTRPVEDTRIREVRIVLTLNADLGEIMDVLRKPSDYEKWVFKCKRSKMVEKLDDHSYYYYTVTNFPWPARDRDLVARSKMHRDPGTGAIVIETRATANHLPEQSGLVRVDRYESTWHIIDLGNGQVKLENHIWADPGGSIPEWMVNMAVAKGPTRTMQGLREAVGG